MLKKKKYIFGKTKFSDPRAKAINKPTRNNFRSYKYKDNHFKMLTLQKLMLKILLKKK